MAFMYMYSFQCTWKVDMHDDPISAADIAVIISKSARFPSCLLVKLFQSEGEMAPFFKKKNMNDKIIF